MKKILLLTILLVFVSSLRGGNTKVINLNFNYEDFQSVDVEGLLYITSKKQLATYEEDASTPGLPWICVNILLGINEKLLYYSYQKEEKLVEKDVVVAPNPMPVPTNTVVNTIPMGFESFNYKKSVYPQEVVKNCTTHLMDGYKYVSLWICPFRYDSTNGNLYFIDEIRLSLNIDASSKTKPIANQKETGGNMEDIIKGLVLNAEEYDALYGAKSSVKTLQSDYEYIIVTRDSLKSSFQALADWKTTKGVRAKVLTIEEINQNYTGSTQQLRIKRALKDYYNGTYSGLRYVLLGGDDNLVPSLPCYIQCSTANGVMTDITPTDMYYACFAKMEWDSNGNGSYGEISDSVSLEQDIYVTRLLVGNRQDVEETTSRIILYEKGGNTTNGNNKLLMCGNKLKVYFDNNGQTISDAQLYGDSLFLNYITPYWNGTRIRFYDTGTDFNGGANYSLNASNLQLELSKGYTFSFMDTHGEKIGWWLEDGFYSSNQALMLTNQISMNHDNVGTTQIITSSCLTNAFDHTNLCLSYAFMKNSNSGVLSYTGCSREGFYYGGQRYLGPSDNYNAKFFHFLFTNGTKNYGKIVAAAKSYYMSSCGYYGSYRWIQFGLNPIGDPEMPIFVNPPIYMNNVAVTYQNGQLNINADTDSCTICVTSRDDCGMTFYETISDVSQVSLTLPFNTYNICVSKPGYAPYLMTFSNDHFIQNETFDGVTRIVADSVNIGSDVTTLRPQGPVIVNNGETSITTADGVMIKNDFEVKNGAVFSIEIDN